MADNKKMSEEEYYEYQRQFFKCYPNSTGDFPSYQQYLEPDEHFDFDLESENAALRAENENLKKELEYLKSQKGMSEEESKRWEEATRNPYFK